MKSFAFLLVLLGCLSSCSTGHTGFRSLGVKAFHRAIARPGVVRLDVRTHDEYTQGHIPGAINIDVRQDTFLQQALSTLPPDSTIAVYCKGGVRSKKAATLLTNSGFRVLDLNHGYDSWVKAFRAK